MPKNSSQPMFQRIRAELRRDPKRTTIMAVLGAIMLVLWGRMMIGGPAAVTASLIRRSVLAADESGSIQPGSSSTTPVLDWLAKPREPVGRNLFAINLDYYARATDSSAKTETEPDTSSTPDDPTDQNKSRQILLANLASQASKLKLQTTLMGSTPKALINGQLLCEGDTIAGFVVSKIEPRHVAIQQDGVTLDIAMP